MPVVDEGRVVGLLTEQGVTERAESEGLAVGSLRVRDVMSTDIVCCAADEDVGDTLERVDDAHTPRLPVIDDHGHLVGIVSVTDLRRRDQTVLGEATPASDVTSVSGLVQFDDDQVDFMSDSSFPASDPMPPPSTLGSDPDGDGAGT